MTVPLPAQGSTAWYSWASDIHTKANTPYTDEQVRDVMGTALVAGSNVTITPNDGTDTITIASGTAALPWLNVKDYGVVGNGRRVFDAAITSGTTSLTSTSATFAAGDVGKQVKVVGAGPSGGLLTTTISSVSSGVATLGAAAFATVSGAYATWGTDDTTAVAAAMNAARMSSGRRGGVVLVPTNCRMLVSSPISLFDGVSVIGTNWAPDEHYCNPSAFIAAAGFSGTALLKQDADGNTVFDPTERPDRSWHQGLIKNLAFLGSGTAGPHGLDPGWNGEASKIEQCQFQACNSGVYLNDVQASANISTCSFFDCTYGVNCDTIQSTVRIFGLSGDNNTSLVRVKGGLSANVTIVSMKAENYTTGTGDPVIDIVDLDGGMVTVVGGWCDTNAARTRVVRLSKTGATTNYPRVALIGLGANTVYYTSMIDDTIAGGSAAVTLGGLTRGTYYWNLNTVIGGQGRLMTAPNSGVMSSTPSVRVYAQTTAQSIANFADDRIDFNTTELNDDTGTYTVDLTTNLITVLRPGLYLASYQIQYQPGTSGGRYATLVVNGAPRRTAGQTMAGETNVSQSAPVRLSAGDVVELHGYVDGGTVAVRSSGPLDTALALTRLGD